MVVGEHFYQAKIYIGLLDIFHRGIMKHNLEYVRGFIISPQPNMKPIIVRPN